MSDVFDQDMSLRVPRRALFKRVLGRILIGSTMVTLFCWLPLYPVQILTEAAMPGEHLSQSVGDASAFSLQPCLEAGKYRSEVALPSTLRHMEPLAPAI